MQITNTRKPAIRSRPIYDPYTVAAVGGVAGALSMSALLLICRAFQFPAPNIEMTLGNQLATGNIDVGTWQIGLVLHVLLGAFFGLLYGFGFRILNRTGSAWGAAFGFIHWALGGFILFQIPTFYSILLRHSTEMGLKPYYLRPEGLFYLSAHLLFGSVVGSIHAYASNKLVLRDEQNKVEAEQKQPRQAA